jgi:hypothetical protein
MNKLTHDAQIINQNIAVLQYENEAITFLFEFDGFDKILPN